MHNFSKQKAQTKKMILLFPFNNENMLEFSDFPQGTMLGPLLLSTNLPSLVKNFGVFIHSDRKSKANLESLQNKTHSFSQKLRSSPVTPVFKVAGLD